MAKPARWTWGRGVALVSGGIDSIVMLYWLHQLELVERVLIFNYGQRSYRAQLDLVNKHCRGLGLLADVEQVKLPMPTTKGGVYQRAFVPTGSDDADGKVIVDGEELEGAELTAWRRKQWSWIEARNALFLTWAAGRAAELGVGRVYVGFQEESSEASENDEVDTTAPFVEAVNAMLTFGAVSRPVTIVSPWFMLGMDKTAIVKLGESLNVDLELTYSCEFHPECGVCGACARRARAIG